MIDINPKLIELNNVVKGYPLGDHIVPVLKGVSLEVEKSELLVIMGPSGSGKSTLLNLLGALDVPNQGNLSMEGKNLSSFTQTELAIFRNKKIGFIFQKFNLLNHLTAIENVMLPMLFFQIPREERKQRAEELLNKIGLGHRLLHKPGELSGGEQQRVAIARALSNDPEIILADEPTGNLDSKNGEIIIQTLKELNKEGKTIIMITHDEKLAKIGTRILKIKDGKIY